MGFRTKWSVGLRVVQFAKNNTYHSTLGMTPYEATFGIKARVGLESYLPAAIFGTQSFLTEEELEDLLEVPVSQESSVETISVDDTHSAEVNVEATQEEQPDTSNSCCTCHKQAGSHKCQNCDRLCHPFCGRIIEEGYSGAVVCNNCIRRDEITQRQTKNVRHLAVQLLFMFRRIK